MVIMSPSCFLVLFLALATSCFAKNLNSRVTEDDVRKLATANNDLAVNILLELTAGSQGNVFFSPLSLSTAFGMLYRGTRGDTAEELRKVLGYEGAGLEESSVHRTFQKYLTEKITSQGKSAYTLNSANAVIVDKRLDVLPEYKTEVQDYYRASVRDVDFATEAPRVVSEINDWVKEKTNGMIEQLVDDLDASTALVLLNAVYFKGTWKTQFDPSETFPWVFYNNGLESSQTKIPMMRLTEKFLHFEAEDAQVLEMPYKGGNISMVILLPNERDGLPSLEKSLTPARLFELRRKLVEEKVHVTIPKFKLEYSRELSREFQSIGAKKVFSSAADFSGITRSGGGIAVSQVLHKAVIEVNEEGSEAAGATAVISFRMGDFDPDFTVDRPFLFTIIDKRNDMILFVGRVTNL